MSRVIFFDSFFLSLISLINVLQFSQYKTFTLLVKFISKYFLLFDVIANKIVYLIYFSDSLLFEHTNVTDLYILILYLATSLNLFMSSNNFGEVFSIFLIHIWYVAVSHLQIVTVLLFLFKSVAFFIVFLITMLTTSSTMLNKSFKCLVSHLGRNILSISPSNMMLAVGLSYMTFIKLRHVNSNYFVESLYHKWTFFFFF